MRQSSGKYEREVLNNLFCKYRFIFRVFYMDFDVDSESKSKHKYRLNRDESKLA